MGVVANRAGRSLMGCVFLRAPHIERSACIVERRQVGHWEGITLMGTRHKHAIVTLIERKTS